MDNVSLEQLSFLGGLLIAGYTILTALVAVISSYVMVKVRLGKLEESLEKFDKFVRGVLFQPDGQTNLMPRSACGEMREGCQNTMKQGFENVNANLVEFDRKREESKSALLALFTKLNESILKHEAWHEGKEDRKEGKDDDNTG